MSIQRIITFLEVAESGSIIKAAKHLNLTQSAASTRIKQLEEDLRQTLFLRSIGGMQLSPAGHRFRPYALRMAQAWQQGRQEMKLRDDFAGSLSLAIQATSWARLSHPWITWMRTNAPNYLLRVESDWSQGMIRSLSDGYFDLIVTSVPTLVPGIEIESFVDDILILVSDRPDLTFDQARDGYIHVDWGQQFTQQFDIAAIEPFTPALTVGLSDLAQQIILRSGGSAYLSRAAVQDLMQAGQLHPVADAPEFTVPHYLMFPETHHDMVGLQLALRGLRDVGAAGA